MTQIFVKGEPSSAQQRIIERTERMWAEIRMRRGDAGGDWFSMSKAEGITKEDILACCAESDSIKFFFESVLDRERPKPPASEGGDFNRASRRCRPSRSARARASGRRRRPPPSPNRSAPPSAAGARRRCSEADSARRRARSVGWECRHGRCGRRRRRRRCRAARARLCAVAAAAREERQRAPADAAARHAAAPDAPRARRAQPDERARAHPAAAAADDAAGAAAAGAREQGYVIAWLTVEAITPEQGLRNRVINFTRSYCCTRR